jgi:hypothetical protein
MGSGGRPGREVTAGRGLAASVTETVERHPDVRAVELVGSRANGTPTALSDWDFLVRTDRFAEVAADVPALVTPLRPLAQQWDRLNETWCYMLMLRGPIKVDLIFAVPHTDEPPWIVSRDTLEHVDEHFWDWILWMASKRERGQHRVVRRELAEMTTHLLGPMGVPQAPRSIPEAISRYRAARSRLEAELGTEVSRRLEAEVIPAVLAR